MKATSSDLPPENLVMLLEAEPVEMWLHLPPYCSPEECLTLINNTQPSVIHPNYPLVVPAGLWPQWLVFQAVDLSCASPCVPVSPELLGGEFSLPFQFSSGSSKKSLVFSGAVFPCCKDKRSDFQALYMVELSLEILHAMFSLSFTYIHWRKRLHPQDLGCWLEKRKIQ